MSNIHNLFTTIVADSSHFMILHNDILAEARRKHTRRVSYLWLMVNHFCATTIYSGFALSKYWVTPLCKPIMAQNILSEVLSASGVAICKQN